MTRVWEKSHDVSFNKQVALEDAHRAQLSPETFDPRKMDANFLEANFEHFRLSTARNDKNIRNCPSYFLVFGLKSC